MLVYASVGRFLHPVVKPAPDVAHLVWLEVAPAKLVSVYPIECRAFLSQFDLHRLERKLVARLVNGWRRCRA
jgi:hypothetical protein